MDVAHGTCRVGGEMREVWSAGVGLCAPSFFSFLPSAPLALDTVHANYYRNNVHQCN